jgi:hypothetical protein
MDLSNIAQNRLNNQQIVDKKFNKAKDLVAYMGAIQAQDYTMAKWAIGLRLLHATDETIEQAIDNGEIIRTHILRPTWHFVSADDIRWMLALTAPQIKTLCASVHRQLGLDNAIFMKSDAIIEKLLEGGKQLTRVEIMTELEKSGIQTNDLRASHIMFSAELNGIVCNGSRRSKQFTYALLDERVPPTPMLNKEEALAELAKRYFTSHAPATLQDFIWWSGLQVKDARMGLESIKSNLISEKIDKQEYWLPNSVSFANNVHESLHLIPAYDEFTISYKDRTASLDPLFARHAMSGNGIFNPIIVENGKVIGIWKRSFKKESVNIDNQFFNTTTFSNHFKMEEAKLKYAQFLGMKSVNS